MKMKRVEVKLMNPLNIIIINVKLLLISAYTGLINNHKVLLFFVYIMNIMVC